MVFRYVPAQIYAFSSFVVVVVVVVVVGIPVTFLPIDPPSFLNNHELYTFS